MRRLPVFGHCLTLAEKPDSLTGTEQHYIRSASWWKTCGRMGSRWRREAREKCLHRAYREATEHHHCHPGSAVSRLSP